MASVKKAPTKTFSRVKNHLAELQRWWPAYVKNDGVHGISVDPILWRTDFSSDPTIADESRVAGIRVEAITDAGGDVSGTEPTIVISGSGTLDPRCTINHADGTSTIIHLIAPTAERMATGTAMTFQSTFGGGGTTSSSTNIEQQTDRANEGTFGVQRGPYPVFMTVQELAELIDTYRHVGEGDGDKPAWLPHGIAGDDLAETAPLPNIDADPRSSSDPMPTNSPYRATVFMPMMLDNNQLASTITGATNTFGGSKFDNTFPTWPSDGVWNYNGITRYTPDPEGVDSSTVKYKRVGTSGDHLRAVNTTLNDTYASVHASLDSATSPPPHYRMAMALACFLKDGTYSLNDGVLIPYVYDAERTVGGVTTDTLYLTWDGRDGYGADADEHENTPAGIYPFFDFVQGPLTPRAQGTNWTRAVFDDRDPTSDYLAPNEVPPMTHPFDIYAVEVAKSATACEIILYAEDTKVGSPSGDHDELSVGDAIYVSGLDGVWGTDSPMTQTNGKWWSSRYDKRSVDSVKDANGWWLVGFVSRATADIETIIPGIGASDWGLSGSTTYTKIHIRIPLFLSTATSQYITDPANNPLLRLGRASGPEIGFGTSRLLKTDGTNTGTTVADSGNDTVSLSEGDITALSRTTAKGRFGWEGGTMQGDCNVPVTSSSNDTFPGRPTIGEAAVPTVNGDYVGDRPVPRSIRIETLGVDNAPIISATPTPATRGDGTLRVPAPLGHDLCARYNCISGPGITGATPDVKNADTGTFASRWIVRSDISLEAYDDISEPFYHDRWAFRGVSTPLWSYVDPNTGRHAWDYIKPVGVSGTWTYGRNRPWPAHERMGTRLSMSPGLLATDANAGWTSASGNLVTPGEATTKIGLSEIGCSPIHLDMQVTAFIPSRANRLTIIEFDGGETDPVYGRHHMLTTNDYRDAGFGFVPLWDGSSGPGVYRKGSWVDISGSAVTLDGVPSESAVQGFGYPSRFADALENDVAAGNNPTFASFPLDVSEAVSPDDFTLQPNAPYPATNTNNRPAVWFTAGAGHFTSEDWENSEGLTLPGTGGFGLMGTGFGNGDAFSFAEGTNTLRTTFTSGGMTLTFNGTEIGTDTQASNPVWAVQFKSCNAFSMADRRPFFISGSKVFSAYSHLVDEEPMVVGIDRDGVDFPTSRIAADRGYWYLPATYPTDPATEYYPLMMPVLPTTLLDSAGRMTRHDNPALQVSNVDLHVDEVIMRQIPTPAMLPFTVDTVAQTVSGVDVARFTSLSIEADNVSTTTGMLVTVTLLEPPTVATIDQEASTVISGFDDLDPQFIGGVGAIDLTGLPTSAITNGFVVRFNFYVPSTEDTSLHPVDWSKTPIVRSWSVYYDHTPTSEGTIIGNTYDGSTATTIGTSGTQTFTSKVGHIVSVRATGETDDPDRKIAHIKVDFGDGTVTDWLAVETPATSVTYDLSHVYSSMPTSGSTYDIVVYSRDDSENASDASDILRVTMTAAEPVAVVRAVPSMVRAGQAIRFDGSDSYTVDTGATISTYTWTFGDGSTSVSGSAVYQDHTYAEAGEFMATLTITDSEGTDSPVSKSVVKVLPATLVVPLTLSTKPSAFKRNRSANLVTTPILDAVYPEVSDTGQRNDTFTLSGMFLKETMDSDVAFMEELLLSGALVEFEYQDVNFVGTADSKTFVGRLVSFDYDRRGGERDRTPYSATFVREAGLGA